MTDATASEESIPQVLTLADVNELTQGFDAGDTVECYLLKRRAPLHRIANSTIIVHKQALGLRYLPPSSTNAITGNTKHFEITIEYGPLRQGTDNLHEAFPSVPDESESSIQWENQAKVYYTTNTQRHYDTANYMTSMTGAVLKTLLKHAVEYPAKRRLYQPFSVYHPETKRRLLRSSSDTDFLHDMLQKLVDVGVKLVPILPPETYDLQVYAWEVHRIPKHVADPSITDFYRSMYSCLERMALASESVGPEPSHAPSLQPTVSPGPTSAERLLGQSHASNYPSLSPTLIPAPVSDEPQHPADEAQQAADEAQQAAQDAASDPSPESAQKAADAAQKAATVTKQQQLSIYQQQLLSGDGVLMSNLVSSVCIGNRTTAYLYLDGAFYYALNLSAPYITVTLNSDQIPRAPVDMSSSPPTFTDYTIGLSMLIVFLFGFLLLLQQIFGGSIRCIRPLYKTQKWFFSPYHYELTNTTEKLEDDSELYDTSWFGDDIIPLSMGGTNKSLKQLDQYYFRSRSINSSAHEDSNHSTGNSDILPADQEIELCDIGSPVSLFRDPDHVELPCLSSNSKVALPVSAFDTPGEISGFNID